MSTVSVKGPIGWKRLLTTGVLVVTAGILVAGLFTAFGSENPDELGWDFRVAYLRAAEDVVAGKSPYPSLGDPNLDVPTSYAYPPQLAIALTPLTLVPEDVAVVVAVVGCLAALMGTLLLLGIRDVRCFAVVPIWAVGWNALEMANVSALLALLLAVAWRYRAKLWPLATALAVMVSLKLFLWPVVVWALATRRVAAAALAIAIGVGTTIVAWTAIGFAGFGSYPDLLDRISQQDSYSIDGMVRALGLGSTAALTASLAVGGALVVATALVGRRGDERRAFVLAITAALALSPIVWLHYLVLLVVPLALLRPRFSVIWLLPIVLWVSPRSENGAGLEPFVPAFVAAVVLVVLLARPDGRAGAEAYA